MGDLKRVGRVGVKALVYFELVSTLALAVGLAVATLVGPGRGFNVDPATLDASKVTEYLHKAESQSVATYLLGLIPDSFIGAFANGDLLQVVLLALLSGFALSRLGELGEQIAGGSTNRRNSFSRSSTWSYAPLRSAPSAPWHSRSGCTGRSRLRS
jgi:aerobic C4-dicarboxylate transport protein